ERKIDDETIEQVQKAELAQALRDRSRGAHVDEQERPLLDARLIVAPRSKGEERPRTKQIVDAEAGAIRPNPRQPARSRWRRRGRAYLAAKRELFIVLVP